MLLDRATVLNVCGHAAQAASVLTDLNTSLLDRSSREVIAEVLLYAMKSLSDACARAGNSPHDLLKVPDSAVIASLEVQRRRMQEARRAADELDAARRRYAYAFDSLLVARDLTARLQAKVQELEAPGEAARVRAARDSMAASLQHVRKANLSQITSLRERGVSPGSSPKTLSVNRHAVGFLRHTEGVNL